MEFEWSRWTARLRHGWLLLSLAQAALFVLVLPPFVKSQWEWARSHFSSDLTFAVLVTWGMHAAQVLIGNLVYLVIYWGNWSFFEQYKVSPKPWPWRSPDADTRAAFWHAVRTGARAVIFNNIFIGLPAIYVTYKQFGPLGALSTSLDTWPDTWTLLWQLAVCLCVEDTMFYWCHRFLHWKAIYKHIHKQHHIFYHSIVLASENAHPVEFLVGNLIPVAAGAVFLRAHMFTFCMFILVRIMETTDTHSGYEFPWSVARLLPFSGSTAAHDFHHSRNVGCYGSQFIFWDRLFGTDKDFIAYETALEAKRATGKLAAEANERDVDPDDEPVAQSQSQTKAKAAAGPASSASASGSSKHGAGQGTGAPSSASSKGGARKRHVAAS